IRDLIVTGVQTCALPICRGIFEGDYVMVSPSTRAKDGDIVAARLGDEATVKTLTHRGATIVLEPASDADRAIEVGPRDDFAVLRSEERRVGKGGRTGGAA